MNFVTAAIFVETEAVIADCQVLGNNNVTHRVKKL